MKRRQFIKSLLAVAGTNTLLSGNPLSFNVNTARAAEGKTLIVIFQRGGCDGLNAVIPYTEERYYQLRPTIGIRPPDANDPESAVDINGIFGFHPALAPLLPIYQAGQLAILPTVHYPNASRSHFSGQHFIESGQPQSVSDGWLNRHLQTQSFVSSFRAVGFGDELSQSLRGEATAATLSNLDAFTLGVSQSEQSLLLQRAGQVFNQDAGTSPARQLLHRFGLKVTQDLDLMQQIRNQPYTPANGAVYPSNSFGRSLMQIAQLTKSGIGLELATASIGGWDHHSGQGGGEANGRQARSHANFAQGIAALYADLGERMQDVVIMTQTEFGRTAAQNGSGGTDHGYASSWYAMGGGIQSGIYGDWPGLDEDQLERGRFLQRTVDYRDIYAEILTNHLRNSELASLLPGHNVQSLGLFNT
jgi:uncharacterized protein (DUF1501 family)